MYPSSILIPILVAIVLYFRRKKDFHLRDLIRLDIESRMWIKHGMIVMVSGVVLLVYVLLFERENLFNLPKRNVAIWLGMFLFYPVFSAYGQEIIFRKFLFMRYRILFQKSWMMILASGISFSFAHIVFFNLISVVLTFIAGVYFAAVYYKTKSVLFVGILHGILGFMVFTVGLGQHFWLDMMEWL